MFHYVSKLLSFLLSPYYWIVAGILLGVLLKNKKIKRIGFVLAFAIYLIFGNRAILNQIYKGFEYKPLFQDQIKTPFEYAVVLGGGFASFNPSFPDRIQFRNHVNRLTECMELYQSGKIKRVIASGGAGGIGRVKNIEANNIETFLKENNWPDSSILIDSKSLNTYENALNSKKILDSLHFHGPVLLITSALHMHRALATFKKQGINTIPYPADYEQRGKMEYLEYLEPSTECLGEWQALLREWVGYQVYRMKGYL